MVEANNTRATSKKIKDTASLKNKSDDIQIVNALVPQANTLGTSPTIPTNITSQAR
jgi:hypothetical protein